jgi:hypothetical protein
MVLAAILALAASTARAGPPSAPPALTGAAFLAGHWSGGRGQVSDTGGTSTGSSSFELVANGSALLRRDHTDLFDAAGKPTGSFDQIMLIYPEGGTLHADYLDGGHVIHYTSAVVVPGRSVTFSSAAEPGAPVFKLGYTLTAPTTLAVAFSMAPPGSSDFHPIAIGTLTRDR